jgi:CheY-like chemotaxis protein
MRTASYAAPGTHVVQFYENERFLHRTVAEFFGQALENGSPALVIARRSTFDAIVECLAADSGVTAGDLESRIDFVEVEAAVAGFMDSLTPDPERFEQSVLALVADIRRRRGDGTIWAYGEMAGMLCRAGNHAAAVRIEELWNRSFSGPEYSVLCGYAIDNFDDDLLAQQFRGVCRQHTHILPAEGFADAPDDRTRLEHVALLQQRTRALAHSQPVVAAIGDASITSTVYVIDDDASVRRSLARLLTSIGVEVRVFASAEAFLTEVDSDAAGCVVLDIQLTGVSGFELQRRMAEAYKSVRVIAMSGSLDPQLEEEALRLGAKTFLRKPFEARELIEAVARALA